MNINITIPDEVMILLKNLEYLKYLEPKSSIPTWKTVLKWTWDQGLSDFWGVGEQVGNASHQVIKYANENMLDLKIWGVNHKDIGCRIFWRLPNGQWLALKDLVGKTIRITREIFIPKNFSVEAGNNLWCTIGTEIKTPDPKVQMNVKTINGKNYFWLSLNGVSTFNPAMPPLKIGEKMQLVEEIILKNEGHYKLTYGGESVEGDAKTIEEANDTNGSAIAPFTLYSNAVPELEVLFGDILIEVLD